MSDWKEEFKAKLLEDIKKDVKQDVGEKMARICVQLPEDKYSDEWISERYEVPLHRVEEIREEYLKLEFAKALEITAEPQYIEKGFPSKCLPRNMWVKWGTMDGAENMLLLGLYATGLKEFVEELISDETKETLRHMLNEGSNSNYDSEVKTQINGEKREIARNLLEKYSSMSVQDVAEITRLPTEQVIQLEKEVRRK